MKTSKPSNPINEINPEFEQLKQQVSVKLKQATDLIIDARILVNDAEVVKPFCSSEVYKLAELGHYIGEIFDLEAALEQAGWQTSSRDCSR